MILDLVRLDDDLEGWSVPEAAPDDPEGAET